VDERVTTILSNARLVLPDAIIDRGALVIDQGLIVDIRATPIDRSGGADWHDLSGHIVVAGFIDVHVHGIEGADTLSTATAVGDMARRLPTYGVTGFCPTTVACTPAALAGVLDAVRVARQAGAPGEAAVLGAHLESNFINPEYRGAQPLECLRLPSRDRLDAPGGAFAGQDILDEIARARGEVAIITVAPELDGVLDLVGSLSDAGHLVSLGHSAATYAQGLGGIARGARHATHLFNRMPPFSHRAPGLVGAVIDSPSVRAEIVCDGYHVHPVVARTAIAALGAERTMAITDGTAGSGLPIGSVVPLGTHTITVTPDACFLPDGTLAGSRLTMDGAFRRLVSQWGLSLVAAARLCASTPAAQLGLTDRGRLEVGRRADLAVLDHDLRPVSTFIRGISPVR
jgi:N-acetylglucosamine-6-phosphate deacetylase